MPHASGTSINERGLRGYTPAGILDLDHDDPDSIVRKNHVASMGQAGTPHASGTSINERQREDCVVTRMLEYWIYWITIDPDPVFQPFQRILKPDACGMLAFHMHPVHQRERKDCVIAPRSLKYWITVELG